MPSTLECWYFSPTECSHTYYRALERPTANWNSNLSLTLSLSLSLAISLSVGGWGVERSTQEPPDRKYGDSPVGRGSFLVCLAPFEKY